MNKDLEKLLDRWIKRADMYQRKGEQWSTAASITHRLCATELRRVLQHTSTRSSLEYIHNIKGL